MKGDIEEKRRGTLDGSVHTIVSYSNGKTECIRKSGLHTDKCLRVILLVQRWEEDEREKQEELQDIYPRRDHEDEQE